MLRLFVWTTIALTCADHWTTWVCLHAPVEGWDVVEANPVAEWLFQQAGLAAGLAIDTALTLAAIGYLALTRNLAHEIKLGLLAVITLTTGYAVLCNLGAVTQMGIAPWSGSL
ncbi:MAG: hypothetical protein IPK00_03095 [Deltaproteobacteria bacterium]|nr:hypothetical protein [Deltaproteobacteria bacterium]